MNLELPGRCGTPKSVMHFVIRILKMLCDYCVVMPQHIQFNFIKSFSLEILSIGNQ